MSECMWSKLHCWTFFYLCPQSIDPAYEFKTIFHLQTHAKKWVYFQHSADLWETAHYSISSVSVSTQWFYEKTAGVRRRESARWNTESISPQLEVCRLRRVTEIDAHHSRGRLTCRQQLCQHTRTKRPPQSATLWSEMLHVWCVWSDSLKNLTAQFHFYMLTLSRFWICAVITLDKWQDSLQNQYG